MGRPKNTMPGRITNDRGQARCWWNGQMVYLGPFGSLEASGRYAALVAKASNDPNYAPVYLAPGELLVTELLVQYLTWADQNLPEKSFQAVRRCAELMVAVHPKMPLGRFGPVAVTAWLTWMAGTDNDGPNLNRTTLTKMLRRLKDAIRWGIRTERVRPEEFPWQAIQTVKAADVPSRPAGKVLPVAAAVVARTLPLVRPAIRAMIRLQQLTGMRPNDELFQLRPCDVHKAGVVTLSSGMVIDLDRVNKGKKRKVWVYTPSWHKNQHRGGSRDVPLGPEAQKVLAPFLKRPADSYCFSPKESIEQWREERRQARLAKGGGSGGSRKKPVYRNRHPRDYYSADSYRKAIQQACKRGGIPSWFPYQIRHAAATDVLASDGLDAARAVLGQDDPRTTLRYAERDFLTAAEVMRTKG